MLFVPNYAGHIIGATDKQIGAIVFVYAISGFFSSIVFGRLADVRGRKIVLLAGFGLGSITSLLQTIPLNPWTFAGSRALVGISAGMIPPALLAVASDKNASLGKFASLGSLGWGIGAILAGIVASIPSSESGGIRTCFVLSSLLFGLGFILSYFSRIKPHEPQRIPLLPLSLMKKNISVLMTLLMRHIGANMIWVIFPIYLQDSLHLTKNQIGVVYLTNTFVQFVAMGLLDPFKGKYLLATGIGLSGVTFYSFTLARNFAEILPTQVLLGISWSCVYVGSLKMIMERNTEKATAAGLLGSVINLSQALGPLLGGYCAFHFGRTSVMLIASALSFADLAIAGLRILYISLLKSFKN